MMMMIIKQAFNSYMHKIRKIIMHLTNSSNERPLFVQSDRPIFSGIGSKKVLFLVLDD